MQEAKIAGRFLPWRDILHDGPVPEGLPLEKLSEVRAQFIVERGWGEPESIKNDFIERDNLLKSFRDFEKVTLWFEHDLYDQLQILQILDWLHHAATPNAMLTLICTDHYLGLLTATDMQGRSIHEEPITANHLLLASQAWAAFRSPTPEKWHDLLRTDTSVLPFLQGAVTRLLEEYPHCSDGLTRTARQALAIIAGGEIRPGKVFHQYQQTEDRRFLGDLSFWVILDELLGSDPPLLVLPQGKKLTWPISPDQELTITQAGKDVLEGQRNWLAMTELDRWIGGVHLTSGNCWCWNPSSGALINQPQQSP